MHTNRSLDFARLFGLKENSGPYIVYTRPKQPAAKEVILHYSPNAIETKMSKKDLELVAKNNNLLDMFVIDFGELNAEYTAYLLNVLKGQIRGDSVDFSKLHSLKSKYTVIIIITKLGEFAKSFLASVEAVELNIKDIFKILIKFRESGRGNVGFFDNGRSLFVAQSASTPREDKWVVERGIGKSSFRHKKFS